MDSDWNTHTEHDLPPTTVACTTDPLGGSSKPIEARIDPLENRIEAIGDSIDEWSEIKAPCKEKHIRFVILLRDMLYYR